MRFVALDLGDRRTGVAVGDSITGLAGPVGMIETSIRERSGEALLEAIVASLRAHLGENAAGPLPPGELVVGLPLNMDGSEGPRAISVRQFAARLGERTGRVVHLHDERLSSADADWAMARSGLTHKQKKERRDALAAAAMLRDFLEARRAAAGGA